MQRTARTRLAGAALALAVAGGLAACTGTSGDSADTKPGDATAAAEPAPPGKFRTLPEPCGAVSRDTLTQMLPGAAAKAEGDDDSTTPSPLSGEASLTYDTDRRVGCTWQSTTSLGSRRLEVDFQRVVSYDSEVSDDEQAERLFAERAEKAGIGSGADSGPDEPATDGGVEAEDGQDPSSGSNAGAGGDTGGDTSGDDGTEALAGSRDGGRGAPHAQASDGPSEDATPDDGKADGGTELGAPSPDPSLPPRTLNGIGDEAFLDDRLKTAADGRGSQRDITLVFRAANVLVTLEYTQSLADAHRTPASAELQDDALNLARQLAEQFTDS